MRRGIKSKVPVSSQPPGAPAVVSTSTSSSHGYRFEPRPLPTERPVQRPPAPPVDPHSYQQSAAHESSEQAVRIPSGTADLDTEQGLEALLAEKDAELGMLTEKYSTLHGRLDRVARVLSETAPPKE